MQIVLHLYVKEIGCSTEQNGVLRGALMYIMHVYQVPGLFYGLG